jgi:hypothetical protein
MCAVAACIPLGAAADTSPNGVYYTVAQDGLYFEQRNEYRGGAPYLVLVDADYVEQLVIPDEVDGIPVKETARFENRVDIEAVTLGVNMRQIDFRNCKYIESFDFNGVKNVGGYLRDLPALGELTVPEGTSVDMSNLGVTKVVVEGQCGLYFAIRDCESLVDLTLPQGINYIPKFSRCTALQKVEIPESVTVIPDDAFNGCTSLENITVPPMLKIIGNNAFSGTRISTFDCPESVQLICDGAFSGTRLTEFKFPASLLTSFSAYGSAYPVEEQLFNNKATANANSIFADCYNLARLSYPTEEILLSIPPAFYQYSGLGRYLCNYDKRVELYIGDSPLTELTIPPSFKGANNALQRTTNLQRLKIADSTGAIEFAGDFAYIPTLESVEIGAGAPTFWGTFEGCENLKEVTVSPKNRTSELSYVFKGCKSLEYVEFPVVVTLRGELFEGCSSLKSVYFKKLTRIDGTATFKDCTSLEEIDFPRANVTNGYELFRGCSSLRRVNMPQLSSVGSKMFLDCISLEELNIPAATTIGSEAFKGCLSLREFDLTNVAEVEQNAFSYSGLYSLDVPEGCHFAATLIDCPDLKYLTVRNLSKGDATFQNLPNLERLEILSVAEDRRDYDYCTISRVMVGFGERKGVIKIDCDLPQLRITNAPWLKRLEINNVIKKILIHSDAVPAEVAVSNVEDYLQCSFHENSTPGGYSKSAEIDFYVGDELVRNLEIPAGSDIKPLVFAGMTFDKVTFLDGEGKTSVGEYAFAYDTRLRELEFAGGISSLGEMAFTGTGVESVTLPEDLSSIGPRLFRGCSRLRKVVFPHNLEYLPYQTVDYCPKLEQLIIPEGVTGAGYYVYSDSEGAPLSLISLPSTFKSFYSGAYPTFLNLPNDVEILCWASTPPGGNLDNFTGNTVHVPVGCKDAYLNSKIWAGATIIDDLVIDRDVKTGDSSIEIEVPVNPGISADAQVTSYEVECSIVREGAEDEPVGTYIFDGDGNPVQQRVEGDASGVLTLRIEGLSPDTRYRYAVKGFTADRDLVYADGSVVTTSGTSTAIGEVEADTIDPDDCYDLMGRKVDIRHAHGIIVVSKGRKFYLR